MKVRFNGMMEESTRRRLHEMAEQHGRSDSNMIEYLIESYYNNGRGLNRRASDRNGEQEKCGKE